MIDSPQPHAPAKLDCLHFLLLLKRKNKLYKIDEQEFADLELAMACAKTMDRFVTIVGPDFEIVGKFGVDSVQDGHCPDGVAYNWNKASRIGAPQRVR